MPSFGRGGGFVAVVGVGGGFVVHRFLASIRFYSASPRYQSRARPPAILAVKAAARRGGNSARKMAQISAPDFGAAILAR